MTETTALTQLRNIYSLVSNPVTIGEEADLLVTKRMVKVVLTDKTGKAPVADIKYLEWYTYKMGLAQEAVYLTRKAETDLVADIQEKFPK